MGTRSFIGKLNGDGSVTGVYCHWDGYPEGVGATLEAHYTNPGKVDRLISLGSISSLGAEVAPREGQDHTFDSPAEGVTVAYHRDRGEDLQPATTYPNIAAFKRGFRSDFDASYGYVFTDGTWTVYS